MGSPASGDVGSFSANNFGLYEFPFNWDPQRVGTVDQPVIVPDITIVSIQLGSPASGDTTIEPIDISGLLRFHSIGIPSEWGLRGTVAVVRVCRGVSIQLGSPASGDLSKYVDDLRERRRFPFNWDPQRVGTLPY